MTYQDIPGDLCDFHDYYRMIANKLPSPCRVVEVGCADGHSAIFLAETLHAMGKDFEMVMVENMDYGRGEQLNTLMINIMKSGLAHKIRLITSDSLNASCKFPDQWAHFVFIDASHRYEPTKADIRLWYRKVKKNYFLAGHDYNEQDGKEVFDAVNEVIGNRLGVYQTAKGLGVWSVMQNEEALN